MDAWAAISSLLSRFHELADRQDVPALCQLFVPEARLQIGNAEWRGREAIGDALALRLSGDRLTCHLWHNLQLVPEGDDSVRARFVQTTFERRAAEGGTSTRISDVADLLQRARSGPWLIRERVIARRMEWKDRKEDA